MPAAAKIILALLAAIAPVTACKRRPAPVPRPTAYPRPSIYPASYRNLALPFGPDSLAVNSSATVSEPAPGWINISYPDYGITINCTLTATTPQKLASVLGNRSERIDRNLGMAKADVMQWPGAMVFISAAALNTPVQFIATDSATYVLSGTAVTGYTAQTDPDSVAPVIDAVAADVIKMLRDL